MTTTDRCCYVPLAAGVLSSFPLSRPWTVPHWIIMRCTNTLNVLARQQADWTSSVTSLQARHSCGEFARMPIPRVSNFECSASLSLCVRPPHLLLPPCCTWMFLAGRFAENLIRLVAGRCGTQKYGIIVHVVVLLHSRVCGGERSSWLIKICMNSFSLWCCLLTATGRADRVQDQVYRRRRQLPLPKPCRPVGRTVARSLRYTSEGGAGASIRTAVVGHKFQL